MKNLTRKLYPNIDEAVAFRICFDPMVFFYGDRAIGDFCTLLCRECYHEEQAMDYLAPRSNCKYDYGILVSLDYGVGDTLYHALIDNFDITEKDFRPVRNKRGEIVYHQIVGGHTMLPIHEVNGWLPETCPVCGSQYYVTLNKEMYNEKGEQFYWMTKDVLADLHDLNVTMERFERYIPDWVVNRKVFEFLTELYPRMRFEPFFLHD